MSITIPFYNMDNQDDQQQQQQSQIQQDVFQQQQQQQHYRMLDVPVEQQPYLSQYNNNAYFQYNNNQLYNTNYGTKFNVNPSLYYPQQPQPSYINTSAYQQPHQPFHQPILQQLNDTVIQTEPDEFIIDLLKKPQERLFLLKLELELEAFIKDEKRFRLDLPNMNSYQRLMVHRLAPYYKLNHYHNPMLKGVYVCKTYQTELPSIRLPDIQLENYNKNENIESSINEDISNNSNNNNNNNLTDAPPQFKIMRRSAESSSPASRSSNSDDQPKADRKILTYEERKTAYEEARARIFQGLEEKQ
ncbi:single-stranded nucleic acid binding R3H [Cokeromyces recurvatus]|uniref:single-stranded nucleic acid binding R3H n=1 Tax=Cokeromyces recurvatus TaxID=90255 RepID=UPI00221E5A09|nr:single-stranded nucleic acid binding R3H [Cokeromyces recurvatus]KAI7898599.1 single-stranded nucleic acid binding R3H [Cokeromyces recurvatus]